MTVSQGRACNITMTNSWCLQLTHHDQVLGVDCGCSVLAGRQLLARCPNLVAVAALGLRQRHTSGATSQAAVFSPTACTLLFAERYTD